MHEQFLTLLKFYDKTLADRDIAVIDASDIAEQSATQELGHLRWMLQQMLNSTDPHLNEKFKQERIVNRWLGFIQGVLYSNQIMSIKQLRDQSRGL